MFIGRAEELKLLEEAFLSEQSALVAIYGRRRIGKSCLVAKFAENKPYFYSFEALENGDTATQIEHFTYALRKQVNDSLLESVKFKTWEEAFTYLSERIIKRKSKKKIICFFDEIQWMAAGRDKLISLLKYYWDNYWKAKNVMLILCGSMTAFMVKKILSSKALYGRINLEILLKGLRPDEASKTFKGKRCNEERLKYMLFLGTVPKYLEEIALDKSFNQNMNNMCFSANAGMLYEVERIFYSQFRETQIYLKIVHLLKDGLFSFKEISDRLAISSGGGLKHYLENLEHAEIIRSYIPFDKGINSKFRKYSLADEYLIVYFHYVEPNLRIIRESRSKKLFETLTNSSLEVFCGFAFERFCVKHAGYLAEIMGFSDEVLLASPYFGKSDRSFQIDLLWQRSDKVITVCEIKYHNKEIGTKIIPEMEKKLSLLKIPRGYSIEKALTSLYGPNRSLRDTGYFNHCLTLKNFPN